MFAGNVSSVAINTFEFSADEVHQLVIAVRNTGGDTERYRFNFTGTERQREHIVYIGRVLCNLSFLSQ